MEHTNLVVLKGLEGNDPVTLSPLQSAILPHVPDIIVFWWTVWAFMFMYMAMRHLVLPTLRKIRS